MRTDRSPLDPDETLIWSGRPNAMRYTLAESLLLFVLGFFLAFFSWGWISLTAMTDERAGDHWVRHAWLTGIPFVAMSAALLLSPAWILYRSLHTTYLVTNKRAIVDTRGLRPHRLSVPLANIGAVDARPFADDHGSIVLKEVISKGVETGAEIVHQQGFIAVSDLARVERILVEAIDRSRAIRQARLQGGA
jgi:hypothetical protein